MRDFFKGWKRKLGGATLVMACVLVGTWVRSDFYVDELWFSKDQSPKQVFVQSCAGALRFFDGRADGNITRGGYWWRIRRCSSEDHSFAGFGVSFVFDERWQYWGFDIGKGHEVQNPPSQYILSFMFIPFWSVVLPLTLVSSWLLLSKQPPVQRPVEPPKEHP